MIDLLLCSTRLLKNCMCVCVEREREDACSVSNKVSRQRRSKHFNPRERLCFVRFVRQGVVYKTPVRGRQLELL